jgi:hypothetical protein
MNTYRLADDVLTVESDDETVVMGYSSGKYFGVRGAVRHLLDGLRHSMTFEEMVADMATHFSIAAADARLDLEEIIPKLAAAGIVVDGTSDP